MNTIKTLLFVGMIAIAPHLVHAEQFRLTFDEFKSMIENETIGNCEARLYRSGIEGDESETWTLVLVHPGFTLRGKKWREQQAAIIQAHPSDFVGVDGYALADNTGYVRHVSSNYKEDGSMFFYDVHSMKFYKAEVYPDKTGSLDHFSCEILVRPGD